MIDASVFQLLLAGLAGWLDRREREVIGYLVAENASSEAGIRIWCRRRIRHRMRMPTRSSSSDRSKKSVDRMIPIGARHFQRAVREFVEHYHRERNHQGLQNALITGTPASGTVACIDDRVWVGS